MVCRTMVEKARRDSIPKQLRDLMPDNGVVNRQLMTFINPRFEHGEDGVNRHTHISLVDVLTNIILELDAKYEEEIT